MRVPYDDDDDDDAYDAIERCAHRRTRGDYDIRNAAKDDDDGVA